MVKYIDKNNTYIGTDVVIGENVVIYPNVLIEGKTVIGNNVVIHMGTYIKDSIIGDDSIIYNSQIKDSTIGKNNKIGPYAHIRENNNIGDNVKIGSFVELKNTVIKSNSKIPHLSYIGDSLIGSNVNIGCGVITANYDGKNKHKTIIKDNAFIGCNANLIAPVIIENNAIVSAGSTITDNVPANALALARARQINKEDYNK
ncbi:MAG: DapH/DapD/GlmU-related protein [Bacilli bacterium]|nr:DapH/DapD/GlmU-related protein [Bacilli bacterium]MDD4547379.1 DapH/DapD/GlmU-related protein [Bacilli bacterium]